jgi:hypothetical protein
VPRCAARDAQLTGEDIDTESQPVREISAPLRERD